MFAHNGGEYSFFTAHRSSSGESGNPGRLVNLDDLFVSVQHSSPYARLPLPP